MLPGPASCETAASLELLPAEEDRVADEVEAPITGKIWKVEKQAGDPVAEEEVILIIESMKMEIPVEAPRAGTLREIRVEEGQAIEEFDILAVID